MSKSATYIARDCPLSVSIPSHDLPPTEALLQTFNSLEMLTENVNAVFQRLNSRVCFHCYLSYCYIVSKSRLNTISFEILITLIVLHHHFLFVS